MTGDERPDIYDDGLREERCELAEKEVYPWHTATTARSCT